MAPLEGDGCPCCGKRCCRVKSRVTSCKALVRPYHATVKSGGWGWSVCLVVVVGFNLNQNNSGSKFFPIPRLMDCLEVDTEIKHHGG